MSHVPIGVSRYDGSDGAGAVVEVDVDAAVELVVSATVVGGVAVVAVPADVDVAAMDSAGADCAEEHAVRASSSGAASSPRFTRGRGRRTGRAPASAR